MKALRQNIIWVMVVGVASCMGPLWAATDSGDSGDFTIDNRDAVSDSDSGDFTIDNRYALEVSSGGGGVVSFPGQGRYLYTGGTSVSVVAAAQANYGFVNWTGTAVIAGRVADATSASTTVTMTGNYTLVANFALVQHSLSLSASPGGSVLTPGQGRYVYDKGTSVSVVAAAQANYNFVNWTGTAVTAGKVANVTSPTTTVTMTGDYTLVANFAAVRQTLTITASEGGSVSTPGEGRFSYDVGTSVSVMASAQANYDFVNWTGTAVTAGKVADATSAMTTVTLDRDCTLHANFERVLAFQVDSLPVLRGEITSTSVNLRGRILESAGDPNCMYRFWYKKQADTSGQAQYTPAQSIVTVDGKGGFAYLLEGLTPDCTYVYRAMAFNTVGDGIGQTMEFTTEPMRLFSMLHVDDDAPSDPGPHNLTLSDPDEDGTLEHPYDSIQEAIEAAANGNKIIVRGGTYYEVIDFLGKRLRVTGFDPNQAVQTNQPCPIIDAGYQGTAVTFSGSEDRNTQLSGFTITRGLGQFAGGILCLESHPRISNCLIVGNRALSSVSGGAVYAHRSHASFDHCTMSGNHAGQAGAGFYSNESVNTITHSILWDNLPYEVWYPMFGETSMPPVLTYCDLPLEAYWVGNIVSDPCFVSPGYWAEASNPGVPTDWTNADAIWIDGDYHLLEGSPCIDAGDPESRVDVNQLDLDGQSRLVNDRVDMGSDEFMLVGLTYAATYEDLSIPLVQDVDATDPETTYVGQATVHFDASDERVLLGLVAAVSEAGGHWTVSLSQEVIGPGMGIDVEITIRGAQVDVSRPEGISGNLVLAAVQVVDGLEIQFVSVNDPGVLDHEGFSGEMSRYETTNAQYCRYLNDAQADGKILEYFGKVYDATDKRFLRPFFDTSTAIATSQISYHDGQFHVISRDGMSMVNHPVVEVSWLGAVAFCDYYGYRLPTQWEWEAVADYDGSYVYGCGDTIDPNMANYGDNGFLNPLGMTDYPYTSPVGYYPEYGYGLCDMTGNVWEWTSSTYSGLYRVLCGGGWTEDSTKCLVFSRGTYGVFEAFYSIGFRVCR